MASFIRSLSRRLTGRRKSRKDNSKSRTFEQGYASAPQCNVPTDLKKAIQCKVILLDDTDLTIALHKNGTGQQLWDQVTYTLDLDEKDYFGLQYTDHFHVQHWLDYGKLVRKQLSIGPPYTLRFRCKFYPAEPTAVLRDELSRYLLFLQLRHDIRSGKLTGPYEVAVQLAALALQAELGDYQQTEHTAALVSQLSFVPGQTEQFELDTLSAYAKLPAASPAEAEISYLNKAKFLEMYGVDMHVVQGRDGRNYGLGLTPTGILVFEDQQKIGLFFWPKITRLDFSNRRLTLIVVEECEGEQPSQLVQQQQHTFVFHLASARACKHLWKCAVEQHAFWRLRSTAHLRRQRQRGVGSFFRLGSRFAPRQKTEFEATATCAKRGSTNFERRRSQRGPARQSLLDRHRRGRHLAEAQQQQQQQQQQQLNAQTDTPDGRVALQQPVPPANGNHHDQLPPQRQVQSDHHAYNDAAGGPVYYSSVPVEPVAVPYASPELTSTPTLVHHTPTAPIRQTSASATPEKMAPTPIAPVTSHQHQNQQQLHQEDNLLNGNLSPVQNRPVTVTAMHFERAENADKSASSADQWSDGTKPHSYAQKSASAVQLRPAVGAVPAPRYTSKADIRHNVSGCSPSKTQTTFEVSEKYRDTRSSINNLTPQSATNVHPSNLPADVRNESLITRITVNEEPGDSFATPAQSMEQLTLATGASNHEIMHDHGFVDNLNGSDDKARLLSSPQSPESPVSPSWSTGIPLPDRLLAQHKQTAGAGKTPAQSQHGATNGRVVDQAPQSPTKLPQYGGQCSPPTSSGLGSSASNSAINAPNGGTGEPYNSPQRPSGLPTLVQGAAVVHGGGQQQQPTKMRPPASASHSRIPTTVSSANPCRLPTRSPVSPMGHGVDDVGNGQMNSAGRPAASALPVSRIPRVSHSALITDL